VTLGFAEHLSGLLAQDGATPAIQHDGGWFSWGEVADISAALDQRLLEVGYPSSATIGLVMRERPGNISVARRVASSA
jgi:hypothetical protein